MLQLHGQNGLFPLDIIDVNHHGFLDGNVFTLTGMVQIGEKNGIWHHAIMIDSGVSKKLGTPTENG